MTQYTPDDSARAVIEALDALIKDGAPPLAATDSAGAVIEALDALIEDGATAQQRLAELIDAFAVRVEHVGALRSALDAVDSEAGGAFGDLCKALDARTERLSATRDALRIAGDVHKNVGGRLDSLRDQIANAGS